MSSGRGWIGAAAGLLVATSTVAAEPEPSTLAPDEAPTEQGVPEADTAPAPHTAAWDVYRNGFRVQDGWFEHPSLGLRLRVPETWTLMLPGALRPLGSEGVVGASSPSGQLRAVLTVTVADDPEDFAERLRAQVDAQEGLRMRSGSWTLPGLGGPLDALVVDVEDGATEIDAMECPADFCVLHQLIGPPDAVEAEAASWSPELVWMSPEQREEARAALASEPLHVRDSTQEATVVGTTAWHRGGGFRLRTPSSELELIVGAEARSYGGSPDLVLLDRGRSMVWVLLAAEDPELRWKDAHSTFLSAVWARSDFEVDKQKIAGRKVLVSSIPGDDGEIGMTAATVRLGGGVAHLYHTHSGQAPDLEALVARLQEARRGVPAGFARTSDTTWVDARSAVMLRGADLEVQPTPSGRDGVDSYVVTVDGGEPQALSILRLPNGTHDVRYVTREALSGVAAGSELRPCSSVEACWEVDLVDSEGVVRCMGHGRLMLTTTGVIADRVHFLSADELDAFATPD